MALLSRERYSEVDIIVCDATPEGDIAAPAGSMALSTEGVLYTKASGAGNTGWATNATTLTLDGVAQTGIHALTGTTGAFGGVTLDLTTLIPGIVSGTLLCTSNLDESNLVGMAGDTSDLSAFEVLFKDSGLPGGPGFPVLITIIAITA